MIKVAAVLLAILNASAFAIGCDGCTANTDRNGVSVEERVAWKGVHDYTAIPTQKDFIKNGSTDYILVVPEQTSDLIVTAKDEFIDLFKLATGITIRVMKDSGLTHDANAKYISLGETTLLQSSGVSVDRKALTKDGVRIRTKDNTVYLVGGTDYGTVNAVYTFMQVTFHYEYYYSTCIQIDKNVQNLKLLDYDVTDVPDMQDRNGEWLGQLRVTTSEYHSQMAYRFKLAGGGAKVFALPIYEDFTPTSAIGTTVHTTNSLLPKKTYQKDHSDWYTTVTTEGGNQLCYTARGNETEFEAMAQEMAKKITYSLSLNTPEAYPYINYCMIGMEDTYDTCACSKCTELKEYYGTESGAVCIFVNRVGEIVEEWMNDPANAAYYREDFHVNFLAYNNFIDAPVKYNEKKDEYVPIDEKVDLRSNVGVYYADIKQDYQSSLFGEVNEKTRKNLQGWAALTDRLDHYVYAINYKNYMVPYDCFNYYNSDMYRYYMDIGSRMYYICAYGGYVEPFETNWARLRLYLNANLLWNCNVDEEDLMDNWFNAMFGEASDVMRLMFDEQRAHMAKICTEYDLYVTDSIYLILTKTQYFPKNTLLSWMDKCDQALKLVEKYKTVDPEYYAALRNHIEAEYIAPAWLLLYLYQEEMLAQEKYEIRDRVFEILELLGLEDMQVGNNVTVKNSLTNI